MSSKVDGMNSELILSCSLPEKYSVIPLCCLALDQAFLLPPKATRWSRRHGSKLSPLALRLMSRQSAYRQSNRFVDRYLGRWMDDQISMKTVGFSSFTTRSRRLHDEMFREEKIMWTICMHVESFDGSSLLSTYLL